MKSASEEAPLGKLTLFASQKRFHAIAGTLKSTKRLRGGSFLVECHRGQQAENLLSISKLIDRKVHVSIHKALNSSKGVIRCRDLADMTEKEICDELKETGCRCSLPGAFKEGRYKHPISNVQSTRHAQSSAHRLPAGQG